MSARTLSLLKEHSFGEVAQEWGWGGPGWLSVRLEFRNFISPDKKEVLTRQPGGIRAREATPGLAHRGRSRMGRAAVILIQK